MSDDSPQWPERCEACGIPFDNDSIKRVWAETLYTGAPNGRPFVLREAPPGAMWHCKWWGAEAADGICLRMMLPDGVDWLVDDGRWVRTGDPRRPETLTIRESIRSPRYHGFVTNGQLVPCGDSQT
ncbi:MAG: hypothetical protein M3Z54_05770 [Gemmatimonadota bacterium]|nr:hypothetical protein [Gemmatimonadota bacterium]